jgi:hypothetical protein
MKLSSNALAFYLCITATAVTTTNAFVPRPPLPQVPVNSNGNTALGYIKEGYETGFNPDFLNKKKRVTPRTSPVEEDAVVIDAVVIEEDFTPAPNKASTTPRKPFLDDRTGTYNNAVAVDDVVEKMKREMSTKTPKDMFPDLQEETTPPPSIWDSTTTKTIHGGSLRTWSMEVPEVNHAQLLIKNTDGNPLHAQIDVWDGPDRAPMKLAVYCANTSDRPFSCILPTPGYSKQSIGIKNAGPLEFPIDAVVIADVESVQAQRQQQQRTNSQQQQQYSHQHQMNQRGSFYNSVDPNPTNVMQGGSKPKPTAGFGLFAEALRSLGDMRKIDGASPVDYASPGDPNKKNNEEAFQFERNVDSVQVLIETNGLACQARIEVSYDRNGDYYNDDEIQQVIELQIEDGKERPFFAVIETPLKCPSTVRIVNLDTYSAFPITACAEPYTIGSDEYEAEDHYDNGSYNKKNHKNDLDVIDASIEEADKATDEYHSVPDITIPATDAEYDFDEEFFFAC